MDRNKYIMQCFCIVRFGLISRSSRSEKMKLATIIKIRDISITVLNTLLVLFWVFDKQIQWLIVAILVNTYNTAVWTEPSCECKK